MGYSTFLSLSLIAGSHGLQMESTQNLSSRDWSEEAWRLCLAVSIGDAEKVRTLVAAMPQEALTFIDPKRSVNPNKMPTDVHALVMAVSDEHNTIFEILVRAMSPSRLAITDAHGHSILMYAVLHENVFAFRMLCGHMSAESIAIRDRRKRSTLQYIVMTYPHRNDHQILDLMFDCLVSRTTLDDLRLSLATATEEGVDEVLVQKLTDMISIREQAMS